MSATGYTMLVMADQDRIVPDLLLKLASTAEQGELRREQLDADLQLTQALAGQLRASAQDLDLATREQLTDLLDRVIPPRIANLANYTGDLIPEAVTNMEFLGDEAHAASLSSYAGNLEFLSASMRSLAALLRSRDILNKHLS